MLTAQLFVPPVIVNSYITSSSIALILSLLFFIRSKKIIIPFEVQIFLIWFPFLCIGAFVPMYYGDAVDIWNLRYFIFPLTILVLFVGFYSFYSQKDIIIICKKIFNIFTTFLFLNALLSVWWIIDRSSLGFLNVYNTFGASGFDATNYWRFIGFFGNPNFDAILFGYGFLFCVSLLSSGYKSKWIQILMPILIVGLFATLSRSVIAALLMVPVLLFIFSLPTIAANINIKQIKLLIKFVVIFLIAIIATYFILIFLEWNILFDNIFRLTKVFSYFENERFQLVIYYFNYFSNNLFSFIFGNFAYRPDILIYASGFTDNDYLYMVLKYGIVGAVLIIWVQMNSFYIGRYLQKNGEVSLVVSLGKYLQYSAIFSLVVAIASVPFSNPKIFFSQIVFYLTGLIFYKRIKKSR